MTASQRVEPMEWPAGIAPRLADGSVDVRAYCRRLDEFFNQGTKGGEEKAS